MPTQDGQRRVRQAIQQPDIQHTVALTTVRVAEDIHVDLGRA